MTLELTAIETFLLALEDVFHPAILYALFLPALVRLARSRTALCAMLATLAVSLLMTGCLPSYFDTRGLFLCSIVALGILSVLTYRRWCEADDESREVETVLLSVSVLAFVLSVLVFAFALVVQVSPAGTPVLAAALFVGLYRPLSALWNRGWSRWITAVVTAAGVLVLLGRFVLWYGAFSSLSVEMNEQDFPNISRLSAVTSGLASLQEGDLDRGVWSFYQALSDGNPELIRSRVVRWTGLDTNAAPIILAFGGRARSGQKSPAVGLAWDKPGQRILVLESDGQLISVTNSGQEEHAALLPDAVDIAVSPDGTRIALLSGGGHLLVIDQAFERIWERALAPETYRGITSTGNPDEFLVVRADGATLHVEADGVLLLSGYPTWPNERPAVDIASTTDGEGHYVLDRFGGVHPRGDTPIRYEDLQAHSRTIHFWPNRDLACGIAASTPGGYPVYVDRYGGLHAVVKQSDQVLYQGHRYPPLDEPVVVDLMVGAVRDMIHILTSDGTVVPIPDKGWLLKNNSGPSPAGEA